MIATSDDDGTGWGWLLCADVSSVLRFFSLHFGLVLVSFYGLLGFRPFAVLVTSLRLRWNTLKRRAISGDILPRPGIRNALLTALNDSESMFETILVYGPRGSGKTTAIQEVLEDEWGVVKFRMDTNDPEKVPEEFTSKLASKLGSKYDDAGFFVSVFKMLKKKKPIVVVSLDSKSSGRGLTQFLLVCKHFAFEAQATRIIVDLSVSRAALEVDGCLSDLCTQGVYVGELDNSEAQLYLSTRFAQSQSNKDQQNLIELAFDSVGGRLLDLQRLCRECSRLPIKDSIQDHILKATAKKKNLPEKK